MKTTENIRTDRPFPIRTDRRYPNRRLRSARAGSLVLILVGVLLIGVSSAGATTEIERVWSFTGGEVAITALHGKLEGVVVSPTKFAECAHQAGEHMWTSMALQPNGSYWGLHQWLYQGSCLPNPQAGPTAWRVLQKPDGSRYLLVCFSEPGSTSQPTIEPSGATAHWTYGCVESTPTAPLPVVSGSGAGQSGAEQISFRKVVSLPKTAVCVRRHALKLKLHDPKRDPLKEVVVRIGSRRVVDVRGVARLKKGIVLKGLPSGTYTIKVLATTVLDQHLSGRRTYHGCGQGTVPLHHRKPHRHG
jgi:hypothetical protein